MEFTAEQQEHINSLIEDKTKGLFTEEELERRVTSEVDRRVESGIQKGLETHRDKWKAEFESKAKLTASELAELELEGKLAELESRELEIAKRSNLIEAKDKLTGADIPKEQYEKFINILVSNDADETIVNVDNFIENYNATKSEIESKIKREMSNIPAPGIKGDGDIKAMKTKFEDMTYMERLELKREDEALYEKLSNDIK